MIFNSAICNKLLVLSKSNLLGLVLVLQRRWKNGKTDALKLMECRSRTYSLNHNQKHAPWMHWKRWKPAMNWSKGPEIANTREGQMWRQTNSALPANLYYDGIGISKAKLHILVPFQLRANGRPSRQHLPECPKTWIFIAPYCSPILHHPACGKSQLAWTEKLDWCPGWWSGEMSIPTGRGELLSLFHNEYNVHEKFLAERASDFCLLCIHFLLVKQDS